MNKITRKSLSAFLSGLLVLGGFSCENPYTFDINDYSLTLAIEDGSLEEEGDITYPELAVLVEGPGSSLWNITVQSEDGETMTFLARTGMTEYMELKLNAFDEGETIQNLTVTAHESAHQEFLDRQNLTAQILTGHHEPIQFSVACEETKAIAIDGYTLENNGFYVTATVGNIDEEAARWSSVKFTKNGSTFKGEKWWPAEDPHYHFYASNATLQHSASGANVTVTTATDVVCAYLPTPEYNAPNDLTFEHIFARLGTVTLAEPEGYTVNITSVTFTPYISGVYNLRTKAWTGKNTGNTTPLSTTSNNGIWCIPSSYTFTIQYTLSLGDYSKSFTKTSTVFLEAGKINNLSGTLPTGDAVSLNFNVTVTPWEAISKDITVE